MTRKGKKLTDPLIVRKKKFSEDYKVFPESKRCVRHLGGDLRLRNILI